MVIYFSQSSVTQKVRRYHLLGTVLLLGHLLIGCSKKNTPTLPTAYTRFIILKGAHYANYDSSTLITTAYSEQRFWVIFDSTAIYQNVLTSNQFDINKLYGFSDNNAFHQAFSARFGWNWLNDSLHLWAYVYNDGQRLVKDLGSFPLFTPLNCSIKVDSNTYVFGIDNQKWTMPRTSNTPIANGYKLLPYFGGDEPAPNDIVILIKEE